MKSFFGGDTVIVVFLRRDPGALAWLLFLRLFWRKISLRRIVADARAFSGRDPVG